MLFAEILRAINGVHIKAQGYSTILEMLFAQKNKEQGLYVENNFPLLLTKDNETNN